MNQFSLKDQFQHAFALFRQGQLAHARILFEEILAVQPNHFDALNLLGVISAQAGNFEKAVELLDRAIEILPHCASSYSNRGNALKELKQYEAALRSYDSAIALEPAHAEAYYNRGLALAALDRHESALQDYGKAITLKPDYAKAYYNRGLALAVLKQPQAALQDFKKTIACRPDFVEAYYDGGIVLTELDRHQEAIQSYDGAIALKPSFVEAHYNRGIAQATLGHFEAALQSFDQAIALSPGFVDAYCNRGIALAALGRHEAARLSYDQAIALQSDHAKAYCNRGATLAELDQLEAAVRDYDKAISLNPGYAQAHYNRGLALSELKQYEAALQSYDNAIAFRENFAQAFWNRALILLLAGEYDRGFRDFEWRWENPELPLQNRYFTQALWLGLEPLREKTILLHSDQGLGDAIQFCRYVKLVAALGATVILEVEESLLSLFAGLEGVNKLIGKGSPLPEFDFHCPLSSLPLAFKATLECIPSAAGYLKCDAGRVAYWEQKLGAKTKPRIGLVWSGNPAHKNDRNRSISLADLLAHLPDQMQYVSLQKLHRDADRQTLRLRPDIRHFEDELNDFGDTAAVCELMDVVVSVDTSVAHLAGAIGKEVFVLLPSNPDWRWLLNRPDSPWYRSAKLYRQDRCGNWVGVFQSVRHDLENLRHQLCSTK